MLCICLGFLFFSVTGISVRAEEENQILPGIYVEDMSLEGKTAGEAR